MSDASMNSTPPFASSPADRAGSRGGWMSNWYCRIPLKLLIFAVVTHFVLFPNPWQLARHVSRILDINAMIEPDAPQIAELELEFRRRLATTQSATTSPVDPLREVERFVLEKVQYEWDWNLWGAADYMPTIAEMSEHAAQSNGQLREDCDGRAVVAASLMRRLGYESEIVTDLRHVWVVTPEGQWMGPGAATTVRSTAEGNEIAWMTLLSNVPMSLSFGIAVFPFWREVVILLTAYVLMLAKGMSRTAALLGLVFLFQGLLFMRLGYLAPIAVSRRVSSWPAWVGLLHICAGQLILLRASSAARKANAA